MHLERAGYAPATPLLVMAAASLHGDCPIELARDRCDELHRRAAGHPLAQANVDLIRAMIEGHGGDETGRGSCRAGVSGVRRARAAVDAPRRLRRRARAHRDSRWRSRSCLGDSRSSRRRARTKGEHALAARHDALRAEVAIVVSGPASALKLVRRAAAGTPAIDLHANVTCMRVTGMALAATGDRSKRAGDS